jgi:hypothetical protein
MMALLRLRPALFIFGGLNVVVVGDVAWGVTLACRGGAMGWGGAVGVLAIGAGGRPHRDGEKPFQN